MKEKCPYCDSNIIIVKSTIIYGPKYNFGPMKCCSRFPECDSYSGINATIANSDLRELRKKCHRIFDEKWKSGKMRRGECYRWLQKEMGMNSNQAHIAQFSIDECKKLLSIINPIIEDKSAWKIIT